MWIADPVECQMLSHAPKVISSWFSQFQVTVWGSIHVSFLQHLFHCLEQQRSFILRNTYLKFRQHRLRLFKRFQCALTVNWGCEGEFFRWC